MGLLLLAFGIALLGAIALQVKENECNHLKARVAGLEHDLLIDHKRFEITKRVLKRFEWSGLEHDDNGKTYRVCLYCDSAEGEEHLEDCPMKKALAV